MRKYNLEAIKEAGRVMLLAVYAAVLPAAIAILSLPIERLIEILKSPISYLVALQFVLLVALRALDKRRHERGKELGDPELQKGLTTF